ncbi:PIN domain-containing protein [Thermococcus sp.]|uniref:PIN domain-containing protein n=1 Tax=Thermococcus sp. TaxID=35749 RepID=UPI00263871DF|nr:PIN domain-containing protein [Thermococcus sp.]
MKRPIVIDTNVLFSFFKRDSTTRRLILCISLDTPIYAPEYLLDELRSYSTLIRRKAHLTHEDFERVLTLLRKYVTFIDYESYADFLDIAIRITPDPKDVDFVALALKLNAILWSNNKELKSVPVLEVLNTREIIKMFPECL